MLDIMYDTCQLIYYFCIIKCLEFFQSTPIVNSLMIKLMAIFFFRCVAIVCMQADECQCPGNFSELSSNSVTSGLVGLPCTSRIYDCSCQCIQFS